MATYLLSFFGALEQLFNQKRMRYYRLFLIVLWLGLSIILHAQEEARYLYVANNSPMFYKNVEQHLELQTGVMICNTGINIHANARNKNFMLLYQLQQSDGRDRFDPLNFNDYETNAMVLPTRMLYNELAFGYNFGQFKKKLSVIAGAGRETVKLNNRYFAQIDWGNGNQFISAGASLRVVYSALTKKNIHLEPTIHAKLNIRRFRITHQFGLGNGVAPVFAVGLEYNW